MHIAVISPFNPQELQPFFGHKYNLTSIRVAASSVHTLVRGFINSGHRVTVITACVGNSKKIITYTNDRVSIHIAQCKHSFAGIAFIPTLRKIIYKHINEFDIIHAQWSDYYAYSTLPFTNMKPTFCSVRDWCPYLLTLSNSFTGRLHLKVKNCLFKRVMSNMRLIKIANSMYTHHLICDYIKSDSVPLIPNPVKNEYILENREHYPNETTFISIAQSLTDPRKNISTLLKAFEKYLSDDSSAQLILIGSGSKEDFESLEISTNVFDNIIFLGNIPHKEVIASLDQSTILVHPAYEETFGNILLEASARRVLCIGGEKSGAVCEVLDFGNAGILCDIHNVNKLYMAMKSATDDNKYRNTLLDNATKRLKQYFSDEQVCLRHINLYRSYIEN